MEQNGAVPKACGLLKNLNAAGLSRRQFCEQNKPPDDDARLLALEKDESGEAPIGEGLRRKPDAVSRI
jgi:hypothetical protein